MLSLDGRNENDYFTVTFFDGCKKRSLTQQELSLFIRPVHDTAGLLVSQMKVLHDRKRGRDSAKPVEDEDFAATQESQTVQAGCLGLTMAKPPPPPLKKSRTMTAPGTQHTPVCEEELSGEDLLAACAMFATRAQWAD